MKWIVVLSLLLCYFMAVHTAPNEKLEIWVVAHSHDDTGWIRTVDEYYEYEVQYIYDTVVTCLLENPQRKFISVEMAFFERWWNEQTEQRKNDTRFLVQNGQFEFVLGGWCMNDEANTNYVAEINQMTLGHQFILDNFGVRPKIAWHVDPFGSSSVTPTLWAMSGFDDFVIARIDFRLKEQFKQEKHMEFTWRGSKSLGNQTDMFTHVLYDDYCTPHGFEWEESDPPIITQPPSALTPTNVKERADLFVSMAKTRNEAYRTPNQLIPLGCDFNFQNANMKYKNMDKLIEYINANSDHYGVHIQYSTLSDYFSAVRNYNSSENWPVWTQDFFPYADDNKSYWTGYFTSRPDVKTASRLSDSKLFTTEQLFVFARMYTKFTAIDQIGLMRDATAVVQHHDGVAGTERHHVAVDFLARLQLGGEACDEVLASTLSQVVGGFSANPEPVTLDQNKFRTNILNGVATSVVLYNNQNWHRREYVRIKVNTPSLKVVDPSSRFKDIPSQVNPIPNEAGNYTLFFLADIPPMGHSVYKVVPSTDNLTVAKDVRLRNIQHKHDVESGQQGLYGNETFSISNEYIRVVFNSTTNLTQTVCDLTQPDSGCTEYIQRFISYIPKTGENGEQASGAYIFRPVSDTVKFTHFSTPNVFVYHGACVDEVYQYYSESGVVQVTRLYKQLKEEEAAYIDTENTIGPIDFSKGGQEIVSRFDSGIASNGTFYTDNNGMEMQQRTYLPNGRPGDNDSGVSVGGNFYPVVSRAYIKDDEAQITVLSRAAHAGSSQQDGSLELMLHRRLLWDDNRGVDQALNDSSVIQNEPLWVLFKAPAKSAAAHRRLTLLLENPVTMGFFNASGTWSARSSMLHQELPANVNILTLSAMDDDPSGKIMLRLMHIFEVDEDPILSQPVTVDLSTVFLNLQIVDIEERTLTMNAAKNTQFKKADGGLDLSITLTPMEIRSFLIVVKQN